MLRLIRRVAVFGLAVAGFLALVIGGLVANPVSRTRELRSIGDTVRAADRNGMPPLSYFQARDGTSLAYRRYPARSSQTSGAAILIHGSSGSSVAMHPLARALAERGVESFVPDMRGHGSSGTRGDIGYIGQLDDDLADMVAHIRTGGTALPLTLAGHSSGGGFALRVAGSANQNLFTRTVLLAPYLGVKAPSTRPNAGGWASPDVPRIIGLSVLRSIGIVCCEQLPVIAFAVPEGSARILTAEYSYRLLMNFGPNRDYRVDLDAAKGRVTLIAGADDELMLSAKYPEAMQGKANVDVRILDKVNHMDVVSTGAVVALVADDIATR